MEKVNFAEISSLAQMLKYQIRTGERWDDLMPAAKESLDQIATSIARIVSGEAPQNWDNIINFAQAARPTTDTAPTVDIERDIRRAVREIPRNGDA